MKPVSLSEAIRRHPELVDQVLVKLSRNVEGLTAGQVSWYLVECGDDPDQPLDEAACADVMLTGRIPVRHGVAGRVAGHFGCCCSVDYAPCGKAGEVRH